MHIIRPRILKTPREYWLDYLRGLACLLVVSLHTAAPYLYEIKDGLPTVGWHIGNLIDSFSRACVPLFFMISGYLFFREKTPKIHNFKRLIAAIIFYSLIAILYLVVTGQPAMHRLIKIPYSNPFYHLWFLYVLIIIYIFAFFIKIRELPLKSVAVILFCIFIVLNPRSLNYLEQSTFSGKERGFIDGTDMYFLTYAIAGALLGASIRTNHITIKWAGVFFCASYLLSSIAVSFLTYISTSKAGKFVGSHYDYNGPLVFAASISLFILLCNLPHQLPKYLHFTLIFISSISLPIYGLHAFILDALNRYGFRNYKNPLFDIPYSFSITIIISIIFAYGIRYIDKNRWVS